jgi:hypothetical protein
MLFAIPHDNNKDLLLSQVLANIPRLCYQRAVWELAARNLRKLAESSLPVRASNPDSRRAFSTFEPLLGIITARKNQKTEGPAG